MLHKIGGKRKRLKQGSVPTKFSFIVEKPQRKKPCYQATNQTTNRIKRINKVNNSNSATCEIKNNSERNEHDSGVDIEQMANVNCHDSPQDVKSLNEQLRRELKLMEEKFTRLQNDYEATKSEMSNKIGNSRNR